MRGNGGGGCPGGSGRAVAVTHVDGAARFYLQLAEGEARFAFTSMLLCTGSCAHRMICNVMTAAEEAAEVNIALRVVAVTYIDSAALLCLQPTDGEVCCV